MSLTLDGSLDAASKFAMASSPSSVSEASQTSLGSILMQELNGSPSSGVVVIQEIGQET